jgi:hypothetical protein
VIGKRVIGWAGEVGRRAKGQVELGERARKQVGRRASGQVGKVREARGQGEIGGGQGEIGERAR